MCIEALAAGRLGYVTGANRAKPGRCGRAATEGTSHDRWAFAISMPPCCAIVGHLRARGHVPRAHPRGAVHPVLGGGGRRCASTSIQVPPGLAEELAKQFSDPVQTAHICIAQVAIGALIFLIVLIIVHLITARISDTVLDSRVGAIDRILGLPFGVARGFVLVVIPYMFAVSFVCKRASRDQQPRLQARRAAGVGRERQVAHLISQTGSTLFSILSRYALPPSIGHR